MFDRFALIICNVAAAKLRRHSRRHDSACGERLRTADAHNPDCRFVVEAKVFTYRFFVVAFGLTSKLLFTSRFLFVCSCRVCAADCRLSFGARKKRAPLDRNAFREQQQRKQRRRSTRIGAAAAIAATRARRAGRPEN